MRTLLVKSLLFGIIGYCGAARGEVFELPLPVTGDYALRDRKDFEFDLGFALAEVHDVRLRTAGTIIGPLGYSDDNPLVGQPRDARFQVLLTDDDGSLLTEAFGPWAGRQTYPEPEPFSAESDFMRRDWAFLHDGHIAGFVFP